MNTLVKRAKSTVLKSVTRAVVLLNTAKDPFNRKGPKRGYRASPVHFIKMLSIPSH